MIPAYVPPQKHLWRNRGLHSYLADRILQHVSLLDMSVLRLASQFWHVTVSSFLFRKFRHMLTHYVSDHLGLRSLMRRTRSIISGSEALDFCLHGTTNPPIVASDLDIYANCVSSLLLVRHLIDAEGYEWTRDVDEKGVGIESTEYGGAIISCTTVVHRRRGTKIQVLCVSRLSALHQLPFFWGTLVMNCLTADGVGMAYPSLTLQGQGVYRAVSCHLRTHLFPLIV